MKIITNDKNTIYIQKKDLIYMCYTHLNTRELNKYISTVSDLANDDFFKVEGEKTVNYLKQREEIISFQEYFYIVNLPLKERLLYLKDNFNFSINYTKNNFSNTSERLKYKLKTLKNLITGDKNIKLPSEEHIYEGSSYKIGLDYQSFYEIEGKDESRDEALTKTLIMDVCINHANEPGNYGYLYYPINDGKGRALVRKK